MKLCLQVLGEDLGHEGFLMRSVNLRLVPVSEASRLCACRYFLGTWNMAGFLNEERPIRTLREVLSRLRETYCSAIGYEVASRRHLSLPCRVGFDVLAGSINLPCVLRARHCLLLPRTVLQGPYCSEHRRGWLKNQRQRNDRTSLMLRTLVVLAKMVFHF